MGDDGEAFGSLFRIVLMAHPAHIVLFQAGEEAGFVVQHHGGLAVFPAARMGYTAAQGLGHELVSIADAQDGDPHCKDPGIYAGSIFRIDTVGTAGQDDGLGILGFDLIQGIIVRNDFAVHTAFTDASGNQLAVLCAEVNHQDNLML